MQDDYIVMNYPPSSGDRRQIVVFLGPVPRGASKSSSPLSPPGDLDRYLGKRPVEFVYIVHERGLTVPQNWTEYEDVLERPVSFLYPTTDEYIRLLKSRLRESTTTQSPSLRTEVPKESQPPLNAADAAGRRKPKKPLP